MTSEYEHVKPLFGPQRQHWRTTSGSPAFQNAWRIGWAWAERYEADQTVQDILLMGALGAEVPNPLKGARYREAS